METPTYGTELYHRANFYADRYEISVPRKNTYFPYRRLPWPGGYRPMLYIFKSSLVELILNSNWHNAATYRFRDIRFLEIQNFGFWGSSGYRPQKKKRNFRDPYVLSCKIHDNRCHRRKKNLQHTRVKWTTCQILVFVISQCFLTMKITSCCWLFRAKLKIWHRIFI